MEYTKENPLRVITLFSGYDSQCMALDRLKELYPDFDYELVRWCEIDKYACMSHDAVYPQWAGRNLGDITKVDWTQVPECDLLTYSFPCTDISSAGQQQGLSEDSGTRSSLLWECRKPIMLHKPKYLMLENVKALTQKKFMPYLEKWLGELEEYGYKNYWQVCNAKNYGVPQNRERVFVISIRDDGNDEEYIFPEPFKLDKCLADVLEEDVDENFYLADERIKNLMAETDAEKLAGNGYEFVRE